MLKSVKGIFKLFCVICVAMIAITSIGSAAWYFLASIEETQEAGQVGDPIRPNQTFGEKEDTVLKELEYYDVYFLAQNIVNIEEEFLVQDKITAEIDGKKNYQFKDLSKGLYYHHNIANVPEGDLRFGSWEGRAESPYYHKLENVETVTNAALDDIGKPVCHLVDANSDLNGAYYVLQFASWSIDPYPELYVRANNHQMNDQYIQVYGTYPYHDFEIAYFNTLLNIYDSKAIYINGKKSIFFYPLYTVGKGYYVSKTGQDSRNLRDSITLQVDKDTEGFFTFDDKYTHLLEVNGFTITPESATADEQTRYQAYRYVNFIVNNDEKNLEDRGYIVNHIDEVNGSWLSDKKTLAKTVNGTTSNILVNGEAGRFNIYLFVKERYLKKSYSSWRPSPIDPTAMNAEFDMTELGKIADILNGQAVVVNSFVSTDLQSITKSSSSWGTVTETCDTRDYFVVVEKRYEPRLIGGRTNAFDYNSAKSKNRYFTQHGMNVEKDEINAYDLRGAMFYCDDDSFHYIDFASSVSFSTRKMKIPNYYFAVQLYRAKVVPYDQKLFDDTKTDAELGLNFERPQHNYKVEQENGEEITLQEPYQSASLLIKLNDAVNQELEEYQKGNRDKLVYKDVYRVQITKADPVADPTFYELGDYIIRGKNGEEGFTDWEVLLNSFNLVRPKESGSYDIFAHLSFQPNPNDDYDFSVLPLSVDIWAYRRHNIFVNIIDPVDFTESELAEIKEFNGNYIQGATIDKYSFRCKTYYYLETNFLYEEDGSSKQYVRKNGKASLSGLTPSNGTYDIQSILQYYDSKGKCLQDIITGRYITLANSVTNPFVVEKNYFLIVVDKPIGIN